MTIRMIHERQSLYWLMVLQTIVNKLTDIRKSCFAFPVAETEKVVINLLLIYNVTQRERRFVCNMSCMIQDITTNLGLKEMLGNHL